jgi:UPF0755 protein
MTSDDDKTTGEDKSAPTPQQSAVTQGAPPVEERTLSAERRTATKGFFWRGASDGGKAKEAAAEKRARQARRRRRSGTLSAMSGLLSFVLVALVAGVFGLISARHVLHEPGPLRADKVVYLPPRSDALEIMSQLEREGVIDNQWLMNATILVERSALKPGEYQFKQAESIREIIDQLVAGRQLLHAITIPEGLTSEQIAARLRESDLLAGDILETPKEGALLPETYKVARGFPRSKLIAKMQEDQRKLIEQIWARRSPDLPFRTPYELVTLASIVEKETGKAEERPKVAAVFVNRLRKGMRLQSDPTIVYGLVGGKATLGRGILRSEIEKYTPYNTYAIDGLPPGPIANPGRAALEATANPAHTSDLYFVADGTGGHVFAPSLDQHNRNVQHWRQIERDSKAAAPDVDQAPPSETQPTAPPPAAPAPDPASGPGKDRRGAADGFGRFASLGDGDDFPPTLAMTPDGGAARRLAHFGPRGGLLAVEALGEPALGAEEVAALQPARAYATLAKLNAPPQGREYELEPAAAFAGDEGSAPGGGDYAELGADDGVASYPVSARMRAEQKARAARYNLATSGSDELPPEVLETRRVRVDDLAAAPGEPAAAQPRQQRRGAIDASQGTKLDPLLDKSWDLNSPKTVPGQLSLR